MKKELIRHRKKKKKVKRTNINNDLTRHLFKKRKPKRRKLEKIHRQLATTHIIKGYGWKAVTDTTTVVASESCNYDDYACLYGSDYGDYGDYGAGSYGADDYGD
jgi:hypothetical protein